MPSFFTSLTAAVFVALASAVLWDVLPRADLPCDATQPACPEFSESYWHARQAFRNTAAAAGALQESLLVYTDPSTGLEYTTDVAWFPGASPTAPLLVHMSGVHGVEGFAGSAVQVAALKERAAAGPAGRRPYATCFVHAVNPYGFAALRRFNENNVDLNRNNLTPEQWKQVLARPPNFARYDDFDSVFNPPTAPLWHDRFTVLAKAAQALSLHGFASLKRAIVTGQYHNPKGVYFGGSGNREASLQVLQRFLQRTFPRPARVLTLDVHTGLGPSGLDSMLVSSELERAKAAAVFRSAYAVESPLSAGAGASAGYQDALGMGTLHGSFDEDVPVLEVTQEFGTVPGVLVARATIIENAAYQHARGSPQHAAARALLKDAFLVPTRTWQRSVVQRGLQALVEADDHLTSR